MFEIFCPSSLTPTFHLFLLYLCFLIFAERRCESLIGSVLSGLAMAALSDHHRSLPSNFSRHPSALNRRGVKATTRSRHLP